MGKVKRKYFLLACLIITSVWFYFALPADLFHDPYSTVVEDKDGSLLSASIASDGQWRFPEVNQVPEKFAQAVVVYEDKRFWNHPGIDVLSIARAVRQNFSKNKVVSGGSTISMQVIRLSRKGKSRTVIEKIIESIKALRLEARYSKDEILSRYASHAPFGGNVVGLEAACWRYFGRSAQQLSWAEACMLAVLPNAPSLIHPGKNRVKLKLKRDRLLDKLQAVGILDDLACSLAKEEPIPEKPVELPRYAYHLLSRMRNDGLRQHKIKSTLDIAVQERVERILEQHHQRLSGNQVYNAAVLVLEVETGDVVAYVGNTKNGQRFHGDDVDVIASPRSTGSILKPFLFAAMLDEGKMISRTLLPDVPTVINGFSPKNFSKDYDGAVHADRALIRSLNIPAVYMLRDYRYEKFHTLLKQMGMTTLNPSADHYGLTLILGGAEGTLWDITGMYASLSRTLNHFVEHPGKNKYNRLDFHAPNYRADQSPSLPLNPVELEETSYLSASSIYLTFDALKDLYRPGEETGWRYFSSSKKIAWKTGTSFGFRDGWAVGVTPHYAVGVWVGNADGEGRSGLTGTDAAAPIMFDVFSQLPKNAWFQKPTSEMTKAVICGTSGYRASALCTPVDTVFIAKTGVETKVCPYHQKIHVSPDFKFRVHSGCVSVDNIKHINWFVLPPVFEYYYKSKNLSYKPLPGFRKDCLSSNTISTMELIYPKSHSRIFIPRELDGRSGSSLFELAHRNSAVTVYWHLDGDYLGATKGVHHMAVNPSEGSHRLSLIDENGEQVERFFDVISNHN
jgi:penicillin-binding protein 1C